MKRQVLYHLVIATIIYFSSFELLAQENDLNIQVKKSEIFKGTGHNFTDIFLFAKGDEKGGFITFRSYGKGITFDIDGFLIDHYDKDLRLLKSTELEINCKKQDLLHAEVKNGMINIIALEKQNDTGIYSYNLIHSPLDSFNFKRKELYTIKEPELIKSTSKKLKKALLNWDDIHPLGEIHFSKNKNFFAILLDINNKEKESYKIILFNKNFELIHDLIFKENIKDNLFWPIAIDIDDTNGDLYLLGKVFKNDKPVDLIKQNINYHFKLFHINKKNQRSAEIEMQSNLVPRIEGIFTANNTLSIIGYYSNDLTKHNPLSGQSTDFYKGIALFDLDQKTLQIRKSKFLPFKEKLITNQSKKSKKNKGLKYLVPIGVFHANDGTVKIALEQLLQSSTGSNYRKDILLININASGTITHEKIIKKEQLAKIVTAGGASLGRSHFKNRNNYAIGTLISKIGSRAFFTNDNTYLFLNAEKIEPTNNSEVKFIQQKPKTHELYAIKIDKEGNMNYKKLLNNDEIETIIQTGWGSLINANEIIFYAGDKNFGSAKKRRQFFKLTLNQ